MDVGSGQLVLKFWEKIRRGSRWSYKWNGRGMHLVYQHSRSYGLQMLYLYKKIGIFRPKWGSGEHN